MLIAIIPRLIYDVTLFIPIFAQSVMINFGTKWNDIENSESSWTNEQVAESLSWQYQKWTGAMFGLFVAIIALTSSVCGHYFTYITTVNIRDECKIAIHDATWPDLKYDDVDANYMNDMCSQVYSLWSCTLEVILSLIWLFYLVQWSACAGLLVMLISVFLNIVIAKLTVNQMKQLMIIKDTRVKLMTEVLNAIKTVKVMVWERHLHGQLHDTRKKEVKRILWVIAFRSCMNFIVWAIPTTVFFCYLFIPIII
ncbi:ABC transporter, putative [Entamoeba invadens IP1]|uniref:ABC transporter, putative n=1 Tax=Entamoeba invadens IP1 TaxID=370355 RepID=L7FN69_ENTIV|nr:ABC transporter, putative [Entamoeba invadens IP1]ELP91551.1 ABC transporter, putative [Entamoeba invadens IP1]|eukprot:XP_004258322.1 ABC transporter, putative [Entamoeba invadens IP1]